MLIPYSVCTTHIENIFGYKPSKILHIGAHTGEEVESYFNEGAKNIIWFEANNDLIKNLEEHIRKFPIQQQIFPIALWNKNEELEFKVTNNMQSSSFYDLDSHLNYYPEIQVIENKKINAYRIDSLLAIDNFFSFNDFEFINIDTQGAELAILKGFGSHLRAPSIKGIYLEVNSESLYKGIPLIDEIDDFLRSFDFFRISTAWTDAGWGDALYIKDIFVN
ncbi:FkbM family methyltransferase [Polynucleobacter paneuropaeus]|nr:FkbM family methyltransferase [Polynucleobacter paneuropaeus]